MIRTSVPALPQKPSCPHEAVRSSTSREPEKAMSLTKTSPLTPLVVVISSFTKSRTTSWSWPCSMDATVSSSSVR